MLKQTNAQKKTALFFLHISIFLILGAVLPGFLEAKSDTPPSTIGLPEGIAPIIKFEETEYNFGKIIEGEKIVHVFKFENAGKGTVLTIKKVQPTCGCTAALLSSDIIAPGGKGEVKATFNSRGFHGKIKKTIRIKSDDPKNPTVQLRLVGVVIKKDSKTAKAPHISGSKTKEIKKLSLKKPMKKLQKQHVSGN